MPDDNNTSRSQLVEQFKSFPKIVVEVSCEKNRDLVWEPTGHRLRSEWKNVRMYSQGRPNAQFAGMPDIPGMRIELDAYRGEACIYDPLSLEGNERLLRDVSAAHKRAFGRGIVPVETQKFSLSANGVASWLYWIHRCVSEGYMIVVDGKAPTKAQIESLKGVKVRIAFSTSFADVEDTDRDPSELFAGSF